MKLLKNKKGFTLIELVVVVTIIGILLAVLVPKALDIIRTGKELAFDANVRNLKLAGQMHLATGGDDVVWSASPGEKAGAVVQAAHESWFKFIPIFPSDPTRKNGSYMAVIKDGEVTVTPDTYGWGDK